MNEDELASVIIKAAYKVRKNVGVGILESAYEKCLVSELNAQGLDVQKQEPEPLVYEGSVIDAPYRSDLVINEKVIVELKTVAEIQPVHIAQLLTYLRIKGYRLGLIINFNSFDLKKGIRRVVNNL